MAFKQRQIGPTSRTVVDNLQRLRRAQNLTYAAVGARLAAAGHPLLPLSIRRIEDGQRPVDVDDLMAFAVVYDVSPLTLLMPDAETADTSVALTGIAEPVPAGDLLDWLRGLGPLDNEKRVVFGARANPSWANIRVIPCWRIAPEDPAITETCAHCDRPIAGGVHLEGRSRGLRECDGEDSGLPHGYNAHPVGTRCRYRCMGSSWCD